MVCNLVTYRARSAVREVGYALGFPRPLVDRVAKALETYDWSWSGATSRPTAGSPSSSGGRARALPAEARAAAAEAEARGLVDGMGQLNTRMPLVGKVPPWRQPPKPADPDAPRPFAWLATEIRRRQPPGAALLASRAAASATRAGADGAVNRALAAPRSPARC